MNQRVTKTAYLLRREFWEHIGAVLWTPIILASVAAFFMAASYFLHSYDINVFFEGEREVQEASQEPERIIDFSEGAIVLSEKVFPASELSGFRRTDFIRASLFAIFIGFQIVAFFVSVFYLLSCLFTDRKDRSILFWKSLPIRESDNTIVKFAFSLLCIPVVAFGVSVVLQLVTALALSWSASSAGGTNFFEVFSGVDIFNVMSVSFIFILYCAIKSLPLYAWLIFSSAWAKRSPFLVAVIPPLAVIALESLIFGSAHFATLLGNIVFVSDIDSQGFELSDFQNGVLRDGVSIITTAFLNISAIYAFVSVGVTVALMSAAIWLRNNRYEI